MGTSGSDEVTPRTRPDQPGEKAASGVARTPRGSKVLVLKVTLRRSKPPIWRRVEVASSLTLDELHLVIQAAFAWENYHLHVFETAEGRQCGDPDGVGLSFGTGSAHPGGAGGAKLRYVTSATTGSMCRGREALPAGQGGLPAVCRRAAEPPAGGLRRRLGDTGDLLGHRQPQPTTRNADEDVRCSEDFDPSVFSLEEVNACSPVC
jgi:hypothetical protein